jgi:hypothetical protein
MRLLYNSQRVTASQPLFFDGCPSRRSLVLKTSRVPTFPIHPCKSVFVRGSLSESYSAGVLRHAIRLSPFWGEDEGEGTFFLA